ncbi:Uncharacterised protein [Mycobacteroides abscessus subsp. massiliense]|nr:Uncharacterised protein [Mycobacteroides abscessus subsp. massiliense]
MSLLVVPVLFVVGGAVLGRCRGGLAAVLFVIELGLCGAGLVFGFGVGQTGRLCQSAAQTGDRIGESRAAASGHAAATHARYAASHRHTASGHAERKATGRCGGLTGYRRGGLGSAGGRGAFGAAAPFSSAAAFAASAATVSAALAVAATIRGAAVVVARELHVVLDDAASVAGLVVGVGVGGFQGGFGLL